MTVPPPEEWFFSGGNSENGMVRLIGQDGKGYLLSPGDELHLMVRDASPALNPQDRREEPVLRLTHQDECAGRYPFVLTPEQTAALEGEHLYYFAVRFADGEVYPVTPMALMQAAPSGCFPSAGGRGKTFFGRVPRRMCDSVYEPGLNLLEGLIAKAESHKTLPPVISVRVRDRRICLLTPVPEGEEVKLSRLLRLIHEESRPGEKPPLAAGWFHREQRPELAVLLQELAPALGGRLVDVERLMKEPVREAGSGRILSTAALQVLGRRPSREDLRRAAEGLYPLCLLNEDNTWNDSGCRSAALLLLKEVFQNGR